LRQIYENTVNSLEQQYKQLKGIGNFEIGPAMQEFYDALASFNVDEPKTLAEQIESMTEEDAKAVAESLEEARRKNPEWQAAYERFMAAMRNKDNDEEEKPPTE
jgi:delta 1-pyrroline-5-carboxylate dehydrogenase